MAAFWDVAWAGVRTSGGLHGCVRGEGRRPASRRERGRFGDGEGGESDDDDLSARGAPRRSRVLTRLLPAYRRKFSLLIPSKVFYLSLQSYALIHVVTLFLSDLARASLVLPTLS